MTPEQSLWQREREFWDHEPDDRVDDVSMTREDGHAVVRYRVTGGSGVLRCESTYERACGAWMLLEHRQSAIEG